jgi:Ser/Thr protein kinase RdoA (MazF antagonist)
MTEAEAAAALWGGRILRPVAERENAIFELALPQGRAALRLHRRGYQPDTAIRSELWWCSELAARGLAVPHPLPAPSGGLLAVLPGGRRASVLDWLEGEAMGSAGRPFEQPPRRLLDLHRRLGALIAAVQATTATLALPPDFTRPRWDRDGFVGEAPLWGGSGIIPPCSQRIGRGFFVPARICANGCRTAPFCPSMPMCCARTCLWPATGWR